MGRTTSLLLPGRGVAGTLSSLMLPFLLAPGVAHANVFTGARNEGPDSMIAAAGFAGAQACTVRFEHDTVGISEGIHATLFVVMDTRMIGGVRRACYEDDITIRHDIFDNTEDNDYTFSVDPEDDVRRASHPVRGQS